MKKKFFLKLALCLGLIICISPIADAYLIDDSYRPINQPNFFQQEAAQGAAEGETAEMVAIVMLQILAGALLFFAVPVAVIMIAISGFTLVTGGADTDSIETSKKHLTWSIIGLLIIILSWSIVRTIINVSLESADLADQTPTTQQAGGNTNSANAGANNSGN